MLGTAVVFTAVVGLTRLPRPVATTGMLDQCLWGWPVIVFEGEDWKSALPDEIQPHPQRQMPVAEWPTGFRFDETAGAVLDSEGVPVFHKGDRVRVVGTIGRTEGDPAPCFYTVGVRIESITVP